MRHLTRIILIMIAVLGVVFVKATPALADEYDEYGYQFSPGYYEAMQWDPSFGGRQGEVTNPQPYPDQSPPAEGSALNNYDSCEYEYCAYGDQPGYYSYSDPAYSPSCDGEYTP